MKKTVSLSLILIIIMSLVTSVYAESSFTLSLQPNKTEVNKNEEFSVELKLSNLAQGENGIIAIGATLDYDDDSLEYVNMEGKGEWSKPSYNKENKEFTTERNGYAEGNETILTVTFKVKEQSKQNLEIKLKNITASNGTRDIEKSNIETNVTVKSMSTIPDIITPPANNTTMPVIDTGDEKQNQPIKDAPVSNNNTQAVVNQPIPNTGSSDNLIIVAVVVMAVASIATFVRMKKFEKEM